MDYGFLIEKAISARNNSHSPYSLYRVGAAILCADGSVYTGCNVENSSFSHTVCAERVAFFKAVSDGKRDFSAIAIVGGKESLCDFAYPCGACRQVLSELCSEDFKIVLYADGKEKILTLGELLPHSFSSDSIK